MTCKRRKSGFNKRLIVFAAGASTASQKKKGNQWRDC